LTIPAANQKSAYNNSWEPYLAANLFLYTVPLAIFLRRARELDFSPREFKRSVWILKRVFRVFTPDVIDVLSKLTQSINDQSGVGTTSLGKTVENHMANLGDYSPAGNLSLTTCQADMQSLLEEIYVQHWKAVRELGTLDKIAAFFESMCGQGATSGEEKSIKEIVDRAKCIVGFPQDFDIAAADEGSASVPKAAESSVALRTADGVLTDEGRQQLVTGRFKCSPTEVKFVGDKMKARLRSHEVAILVTLTTELSYWLNRKLEKFGFSWRVNFRWFADYRNLMFSVLVASFVFKLKLHHTWIFMTGASLIFIFNVMLVFSPASEVGMRDETQLKRNF